MRFQIPSNWVCTPMEKGTMIQPPFRLMGVLPLLVTLPSTRTSMLLYGRAASAKHWTSVWFSSFHAKSFKYYIVSRHMGMRRHTNIWGTASPTGLQLETNCSEN